MKTPVDVTLDKVAQGTFKAHEKIMMMHLRALACHCECLGMNAENSLAVCQDRSIPYSDGMYYAVMKKWELIDKEGKPII